MQNTIFSFLLIILLSPTVSYSNEDSKQFLAMEKRIIGIYENNVSSVVNVANIKVANNYFYGEVEVPQGAGTGFVWDDKGHIVTNFHVVQGGDSFIVTFHNDKKQYKAKVIGSAPKSDIAILKLSDPPESLKPINVGLSKNLKVGQLALAIGNPFGFDHSISRGIISALGRKMDGVGGVKINDMIQTDASINQGNSGGPLLDSSGRLIGMNTMIVSGSGSSAGLGFAVSVDTISRIAPQLIKHGKVIRPGLGIGVLEESIRKRYIGDKGVALSFVDPDGAAGRAGLQGMLRDRFGRVYIGDVIISINGVEVNSRDDIYQELTKYQIGDSITIIYLRKDKKKKTKVTLKEL